MNKENISKVYLLSVPLDSTYKNTLYFSSKSAQQTYFQDTIKKSYSNFTYVRKDNVIYVPDHIDNIYDANYVMYQNTYYENKWFYAFIKDMKYESDECTIIEIETDVIQTWLFDYTLKESFVEREHIKNDVIGENTIPEGLETGDYIINNYEKDGKLTQLKCVMASTVFPFDESEMYGKTMNGMFSGMCYYVCDHLNQDTENQLKSEMQLAIESVVDSSGPDAIQGIFMAPDFLVADRTGIMVNRSTEVESYEKTVSKHYSDGLDGYIPRNKKLLCHPYKHLRVSNGNSGEVIFPYEYFTHYDKYNTCPDAHFTVKGSLNPGCSIRLIPQWYKGIASNESEGVNLGKLPICNWSCDLYTNWMTQNGVNVVSSVLGSAGQSIMGVAMMSTPATAGMGVASTFNGVTGVLSALNQVKVADMQPPQSYGNVNNGDVITSSYSNTFHFYDMTIKKEYAQIIDSYFDVYGYKVNRVKVPESNHMSRYWYTKTIDANITGDIPTNDLNKIRSCYDNGITFWKSASNMFVYPSTNDDGTIKNSNR